tara:strand:- start:272 stop:1522 length:1251 start_codon:yes stop_codon:yes gene_type:complete
MFIEFDGVVWEVPVLDGFSFSQATNSTEITLNEMESTGGVSRRGRRAFNDSLAPGEWSFSTYVRPFKSSTTGTGKADSAAEVHAVEEVLWALFAGAKNYDVSSFDYDTGGTNVITPGTSSSTINLGSSNSSTLGTANVYFVLGSANRKVMKLKDVTVNEASVDFDIDGIATINWSGSASEVLDFTGSTHEDNTAPVHSDTTQDGGTIAIGDVWLDANDSYRLYVLTNVTNGSEARTVYRDEAVLATNNFIRNRLTVLSVTPTTRDPDSDSVNELETNYSLTLTGGNVTFTNNISYITPEELGIVNVPIGHVTGTRSVSGSFTCYLTEDTSATNASADFFDDLRGITNVVTNSFALVFKIGGASGTPRLELNMPTCHLEIPTHSVEDVISLETNFMALPTTIAGTDEATIIYHGDVV